MTKQRVAAEDGMRNLYGVIVAVLPSAEVACCTGVMKCLVDGGCEQVIPTTEACREPACRFVQQEQLEGCVALLPCVECGEICDGGLGMGAIVGADLLRQQQGPEFVT